MTGGIVRKRPHDLVAPITENFYPITIDLDPTTTTTVELIVLITSSSTHTIIHPASLTEYIDLNPFFFFFFFFFFIPLVLTIINLSHHVCKVVRSARPSFQVELVVDTVDRSKDQRFSPTRFNPPVDACVNDRHVDCHHRSSNDSRIQEQQEEASQGRRSREDAKRRLGHPCRRCHQQRRNDGRRQRPCVQG